ncbi:hypothetical protein FRC02_008906 [Tulasnella sp. 418]|nr:hypothetical protein FRC02_008906 [Tulasnella sp. 418]
MLCHFLIILTAFAQFIRALSVPSATLANGVLTLIWISQQGDPTSFSVELVQADRLIDRYAIANNVPTSQGSLTIPLPPVPAASGYSVQLVNVGNIDQVYATSPAFTVSEADFPSVQPSVASTTVISSAVPTLVASPSIVSSLITIPGTTVASTTTFLTTSGFTTVSTLFTTSTSTVISTAFSTSAATPITPRAAVTTTTTASGALSKISAPNYTLLIGLTGMMLAVRLA